MVLRRRRKEDNKGKGKDDTARKRGGVWSRRKSAGATLRLARTRLNLLQHDVGERFDLSGDTISAYETRGAPQLVAYAALGLLIAEGVPMEEARRLTGF